MPRGQHATGWVSGAPTPAQINEFFDQIRSGQMTQTRLQPFLNKRAQPETVHVSGEYAVSCHEGPKAIARHLAEGGFKQRDYYGVNDANYPQGNITTTTVKLIRFLYFGRLIGTDEALREFDRLEYKAAGPTAVLGFYKRYKDEAYRFDRVAALGQFHFAKYSDNEQPSNLAVCTQRNAGQPEAWAFPGDIWGQHDPDVRFAVIKKKKN